jgi:hypothetical protein
MTNVFLHLSEAYARRDDGRSKALASTLDQAYRATFTAGIDLHADDIREGLRALVRLVLKDEPADKGRHATLVEMLALVNQPEVVGSGQGPRIDHCERLRQCARAWRAFAATQSTADPRGAAIFARWDAEAALLEAACREPREVFIAKGPDSTDTLIHGRIAADHDFGAFPKVVVFTGPGGAHTLGPVALLPEPWRPLIDHARALLSAVYDREPSEGSALWRLRSGMPNGVIRVAGVLELFVIPDQPDHVGTHFGKPVAIAEILAALDLAAAYGEPTAIGE